MQLRSKDLSGYRSRKLTEQNNQCPLCGLEVVKPVMDHAHLNEPHEHHVRSVLCSQCNTTAGSLWKVLIRSGTVNRLGQDGAVRYLANLGKYYQQDYSQNPYHPNRPKDEEKRLLRCTKQDILKEHPSLQGSLYEGCTKADLIKIIIQQMK